MKAVEKTSWSQALQFQEGREKNRDREWKLGRASSKAEIPGYGEKARKIQTGE